MTRPVVAGYTFHTVGGELVGRNEDVCQIVARVESDETLDTGPAFRVKFGDGFEATAYSAELRPYYPT